MDGCTNLFVDDIVAMKDKINEMNDRTVDSKYQNKLIETQSTTSIDFSNQTIDITDFKMIGQCKNLSYLNLSNTKVKKSSSDTILNDENTVDK